MFAFLSKPRAAPGPSELLIAREKRARLFLKHAEDMASQTQGLAEAEAAQRVANNAKEMLNEVEQVLRESYDDLEAYPVPAYLKEKYGGGAVNMAVTGASGVGKSSFINAIRRMKSNHELAAKTGFTETTLEPRLFEFSPGQTGVLKRIFQRVGRLMFRDNPDDDPIQLGDRVYLQNIKSDDVNGQTAQVISVGCGAGFEVELLDGRQFEIGRHQISGILHNVALWDLPGVGTANFPQHTYLQNMGIRHFDLVVVLTAARFTEAELRLIVELKRWKVPYFLVRTKIDSDIETEIERAEENAECEMDEQDQARIQEQTISRINDFFLEYGIEKVYCISNRPKHRVKFDFLELEADLEKAVREQRIVEIEEMHPLGSRWAGRELALVEAFSKVKRFFGA